MSVFIHVTVVPAAMLRSSGANALSPNVEAPTGIVTDDELPPGVGAGDGVGDGEGDGDEGLELPLPQPIAHIKMADNVKKRTDNMGILRA